MLHPIALPGTRIKGNIWLAPLAGYTDVAFRSVCLAQGADFAFTEMVSSEACYRRNEKTLSLLQRGDDEKAYGIQLFTGDPLVAAASLREILPFRPSLIDLNCGCSIPKILRSGSGAALLQNPAQIAAIIRAMKGETDIPLSIKIRSGWDMDSINYREIAASAVKEGISLLTLHPRTRSQVFGGHADWEHIRLLKKEFPTLPVIGSGDLFTVEDVRDMLEKTGCDGVMLARGAIGNPFLFRQVKKFFTQGSLPGEVSPQEIFKLILDQLRLAIRFKGERRACKEMRKQFCAYTRGLPHSAPLRQQAVHAETFEEYEELIGAYLG